MSNFKREYLNREEENFYMVSQAFIQMIEGKRTLENRTAEERWNEWGKRGMLTPGMQRNIKLTYTYLRKFIYDIEANLDKTTVSKLRKKLNKFDFKIVDDYTLKKLFRQISDSYKYAVMKRDVFMQILEDIAEVRCVGCNKDYKTCPLYKAFDDISIAFAGEKPNCPYAADLTDCTPEERKDIEHKKSELKKKNKFYK